MFVALSLSANFTTVYAKNFYIKNAASGLFSKLSEIK